MEQKNEELNEELDMDRKESKLTGGDAATRRGKVWDKANAGVVRGTWEFIRGNNGLSWRPGGIKMGGGSR